MEITERYLRELDFNEKATLTMEAYKSDIAKLVTFLEEKIGEKAKLEDYLCLVDYDVLEDFKFYLIEKGYARSSINRYLTGIKSFFEYYSKRGSVNPAAHLKGYSRVNSKEKKSLSKDEVIRLLNQTQTKRYGERFTEFLSARDRFLISLLATTGLRIEEALTLTFNDLEKFDDYIIANISIHEGATKLNKRIPISGKVLNYYNNYMAEYEKKYDMLPDNYVIVSPRSGKKIATTDSNHMIKKYCKEIELEGISNHCFRKFANNALLITGANTTIINSILGWSDKSMSGSVYLDDKQLDSIKADYCRKILE